MSLLARIKEASENALRDKNMELRSALSHLYSEARKPGDDAKGGKRESTDNEVIDTIKTMIKRAQDNVDRYPGTSLSQEGEAEIKILMDFLPKQLTEEEMHFIIDKHVEEKTLPNIMSYFKTHYAGYFCGKTLSAIAKAK